jgi:hypothetical protein
MVWGHGNASLLLLIVSTVYNVEHVNRSDNNLHAPCSLHYYRPNIVGDVAADETGLHYGRLYSYLKRGASKW